MAGFSKEEKARYHSHSEGWMNGNALRDEARRCRRLARSINDQKLADELEARARDLDEQAAELEKRPRKSKDE